MAIQTEIKRVTLVVSAGANGGDYDVAIESTQTFDIGDRFGVPSKWRCVAAWYFPTDNLVALGTVFHNIDVKPRLDDVDLTLRAKAGGRLQIAVMAAFEHD